MNVGIIGNGFVGNAVYQNFKTKLETKVYDIDSNRSYNSLQEVLDSNLIFVCLPTPMSDTGECDLSYILELFENKEIKSNGIFIIKSTVSIGTTVKLSKIRQDLKIIHNPEFLTAVNAVEDFRNSDRNILGGYYDLCKEVEKVFVELFPHIPTQITTSNESETIKYFSNCFLASKIAFFNNLYETCQKLELDYTKVSNGVCSDTRIGHYHSTVPGPDGQFGFGGYCFPKDINAFIAIQKKEGIDSSLFESVWNYNLKVRK